MSGPSPLALWAAMLLALDAPALGGLRLRGAAGPLREAWLARLREAWPAARLWQRLPLSIADDRLIGGLDLVATLAQGRSVAQQGLLAQCHGGLVVVPMAERLPLRVAAPLAGAIDRGEVLVERDGFTLRHAARFGVLALDEALPDDEPLAAALAERLALDVQLEEDAHGPADDAASAHEPWPAPPTLHAVAAARGLWPAVQLPDALLETLCATAAALGVDSLRRAWLALCVMRMAAALAGRGEAGADELRIALALVVVPHATRMPAAAEEEQSAEDAPDTPDADHPPPSRDDPPDTANDPAPIDIDAHTALTVAAALARLPPGLLARLAATVAAAGQRRGAAREGRSGALAISRQRGRPLGARPGDPRRGDRLSLVDTLRAAAPWQRLRRQGAAVAVAAMTPETAAIGAVERPRLQLRRDDLRVARRAQRRGSTTLFVIDASGSAALHRLAEAKGAIELLLAESYARRDEVAVIAFRGTAAQLLLPPTRSLVRAKRALAGLPGGGGTPLAAALDAAAVLAEQVARRGATPSIVLLSDGRANVARTSAATPRAGRAQAEADALAAARLLAAGPARCLVIDTSPQPGAAAQRIAAQMGATYLPLPHAQAQAVSAAAHALRGPRV